MKVAVDIDGTITRWPKACLAIMNAFPGAWILTGYAGPPLPYEELQRQRIEQLTPILGEVQQPIHICVASSIRGIAKLKGQFCRDRMIDLFIDDHELYCSEVRRISPRTAVLRSII